MKCCKLFAKLEVFTSAQKTGKELRRKSEAVTVNLNGELARKAFELKLYVVDFLINSNFPFLSCHSLNTPYYVVLCAVLVRKVLACERLAVNCCFSALLKSYVVLGVLEDT